MSSQQAPDDGDVASLFLIFIVDFGWTVFIFSDMYTSVVWICLVRLHCGTDVTACSSSSASSSC